MVFYRNKYPTTLGLEDLSEYLKKCGGESVTIREGPSNIDPGEKAVIYHYDGTTITIGVDYEDMGDLSFSPPSSIWLSVFANDDETSKRIFSELEQVILGKKKAPE